MSLTDTILPQHLFFHEDHSLPAPHKNKQITVRGWSIMCCCYLCQIALLKLLLAAAPTSKAKTDSINILADVLPEEMP